MMKTYKAWSHSALTSFELCPKKYYATTVAKSVKEELGEAVTWGSNVHSAFEKYLRDGTSFPLGMKQFKAVADKFAVPEHRKKAVEIIIEQKLAINRDFQPSGYFDKDVWVRSVVDYGIINGSRGLVVDWKTGKRKDDDDQLALMAGVMFAQDERLEVIDSTFVWLQEKSLSDMIQKVTFRRADLPEIWQRFIPRVDKFQQAFRDSDFPPNPNFLCRRHCPVTSCPYHGT